MAEIMAPAGGPEQLEASVRSGADRIYFGCGAFNARRNAHGFESPEWVIEYCHARGVKATAALNILLHDSQLKEAAELLLRIAKAGVDGVIVQDLAVATMAKQICPQLPIHASTQMTIHNVEGALALQDMGFSRIVLARELSMNEIRAIREAVDIELEMFVHGALCMSMSGTCYLSSMLGGRSGNRGLCAQPCRLDFDRGDKNFALSLKDMSYLPLVRELAEIGVDSFKIEGRMKRPEYAAAVVSELKKSLYGAMPDMKMLRTVFSRSGFTDGYLMGKRDASMFGYRTKDDTKETAAVLPKLSSLYRHECQRIPVSMQFTAKQGSPSKLEISADSITVTAEGAVPSLAINRPLMPEFVKDCLAQCGGTPYFMNDFSADIDDGIILPMSELKAMRRNGLNELSEKRIASYYREAKPFLLSEVSPYHPLKMTLRAVVQSVDQFRTLPLLEAVYVPAEEIIQHVDDILHSRQKIIALLPALHFSYDAYFSMLEKLKQVGIADVCVQNIGDIGTARSFGFHVHGGHGLNILNTLSLSRYQQLGLCDTVLSFELSKEPLAHLGGELRRGFLVYGHLPLMQMRACPLRRPGGCRDCKGEGALTDRKGITFRLQCNRKQYTTLYNAVPLYLADRMINVDFGVLSFTHESPEQCAAITQMALKKEKPDFPHTRGLSDRELL